MDMERVPLWITNPPTFVESTTWFSSIFTAEILLFLILIVLVVAYLPKLVGCVFKVLMWSCIVVGGLVMFLLLYENYGGM